MQHRIDALFVFLASQYCDSAEETATLLSEKNFEKAAKVFEVKSHELREHIYECYLTVGIDHADGMFRMAFCPQFRN